ncbi:hypothetical protein F5876DRAFT_71944 [Lentinula aff. lateritia]|uniref:Uncharacterized protein n=1 Tax=Lentinula aff. lateritia TaxID=2804960 RepID=A0ACC1UF58_9AGAR|nr:hypothetical protein F5876DRAFT_71944 [Lentinula aff. lateritia]
MQLNTSTSSSPALAFCSSQSLSSNSSVDRLSLPPELTDYILDYFHDDKHTLFTCSLVSRSFNATCRYHVFSKGIDISSTPEVRKSKVVEGIDGIEDDIEHARKKGKVIQDSRTEVGLTTPTYIDPASSAASFIRIVLAPSSTVAPFLQELCLVLRPSFSLYSVPPKSAVPANAWLDELLALLPATTVSSTGTSQAHRQNPFHIRTLRIFRHGVDLSPFSRLALHQNFAHTVKTLALFETTLQERSLQRDMEWVCGFENLEDLLFYGHHRGERRGRRTAVRERNEGEGIIRDIEEPGTTERESPWGWGHSEEGRIFDLNEAPEVIDAQGGAKIRLPLSIRRLRLDLPGPALEAVMRWLLAHKSSGSTEVEPKQEIEAQREGRIQSRRSIGGVPCVSALHIFRVMDDKMPALRAYLCACKDTLQDLMMFLYQGHTKRGDFDLSSHTALRSVYLASNGSKPMRVLHDILSTLQALPTSSSKTQMRKIYLQIPQWQLASDDDAWGTLDGLLKGLLEFYGKELKVSAIVDGRHQYDISNENEEEVTFGLRCMLRERLPLLTSSMSPIGSARSLDKARNEKQDNSRFTILSNSTREVAQYVDEVYGRMRSTYASTSIFQTF